MLISQISFGIGFTVKTLIKLTQARYPQNVFIFKHAVLPCRHLGSQDRTKLHSG